MLYLVGLGLGDAEDITLKGLKCIQASAKVYLESYTSILSVGTEVLEQFYGKKLILADRDMVESYSDKILEDALEGDVSFLVVGDPFGATTHTDLLLRAREKGVKTQVVHNASIINAAGCCGLQLYRFGEVVSIVMWEGDWKPQSFYDKIVENKKRGLHTLCLLDIKMKEQTIENIMKKRPIYEPPRFLTASEACLQLMEICEEKKDGVITPATQVVALARVGATDQSLYATSLQEMTSHDMGPPLHSLIVVGDLHPLEAELVAQLTKS